VPVRILVVDDELNILAAMEPLLTAHGYEVTTVTTGRAAITTALRESPDLIVLDLGLPDIDGVEVCRAVREERATPIIVLSARGAEADKVRALDAGADDYVTKPFGTEELLARIRAGLRRSDASAASTGPLTRGDLVIDRTRNRVRRGDVEIRLTPKELELLELLAQHPGRVLTHRSILKSMWGLHAVDQPQQLRVLVAALRKKIEPDPARPRYIVTEPWVGYRFMDGSDNAGT
jgi:two-component system, OmpR family, KDP operon response regulator KdpE